MISKRKAPHVADTALSRVINQVYDDINSLIDSVNQEVGEDSGNSSGQSGDIRLVFDKTDKKYYIEGKFETGWARTEVTLVGK